MEKTIYVKKSVGEDGMPENAGYYFCVSPTNQISVALFDGAVFSKKGIYSEVAFYLVPVSERAVEERAMSPRIAKQILAIRDAFAKMDYEDAYHQLYRIASPIFDKVGSEVWADIEKTASLSATTK